MLGKFIIPLAVISTMFFSSCTGVPFDSEKWKNWREGEADMGGGLRWKMVDNLLKNYELEGMLMRLSNSLEKSTFQGL